MLLYSLFTFFGLDFTFFGLCFGISTTIYFFAEKKISYMSSNSSKRHQLIINEYENILHNIRRSATQLPGKLITYVPFMCIYEQIADKTGYSSKYVGDVIRGYLKNQGKND